MSLAVDRFKGSFLRELGDVLDKRSQTEGHYSRLFIKRKHYKNSYIEYQSSKRRWVDYGDIAFGRNEEGHALGYYYLPVDSPYTFDYTNLKDGDVTDVCKSSFIPTQHQVLIHVLELPKSELPLYLNSKEDLVRFVVKWRLEHGI